MQNKKTKQGKEDRALEQILSVPASDGGRHRRRKRRGGENVRERVCVCVSMQIHSPEGEHCSRVGDGGIRGRWELN